MTHSYPAGAVESPTGWPGAMGSAPEGSAPEGASPRRPGIATAAAVLGFVEAGLVLLALFPSLWRGAGGDATVSAPAFVGLTATLVLCGVVLVGGVRLLRGVGWRMVVGATSVEIAGLLTLTALPVLGGFWPDGGQVVTLVVLLTLPTVRLGLLLPRSVAYWVDRQTPPPRPWVSLVVMAPVVVSLVLVAQSV